MPPTMDTAAGDHELGQLLRATEHVARTYCRGPNHTVAAAARTRGGRVVTGVNAMV